MSMIWQYTDPTTSAVVPVTNRTPTTGAEVLYHLLQALLASGQWTHWASSDGISVSTPAVSSNTAATPNRVTNFNPVAATAGSINNASAWWMVRHTATGKLLGCQHSSTQTANTTLKMKHIPQVSTGVSANVFTAGTTSQMPLFADAADAGAKYMRGAISTFSTHWGADGTYRMNIGVDNADGTFYLVTWGSGTGTTAGFGGVTLDILVTSTFPNTDVDPYVWYHPASADTPWTGAGLSTETVHTATATAAPAGSLRKGLAGEGYVSFPCPFLASGANVRVLPGSLGSNPHSGADDGIPLMYMRRGGLTGPVGWKGISTLIRMNSANRATGEPLTKTTTRDRLCIGEYNLPWDGSVPVI